jgi:DNA-binding NarL/FixJ family response regulator
MDLRMPGMDGVEAIGRVLAGWPDTAILVLTMLDDEVLVRSAMRAGARGYLLKTADQADIERALHAVAAGQVILSDAVVPKVLEPAPPVFADLTDRERAVLDALATGASNAAIGARLYLAPQTVANHLSRIFVKLGVDSRVEAIIRARDAGYGRRD